MLVEWQLVRTSLHTGASHRSASEALQILHGESRISAPQSVGGRASSDGPDEKRVALKSARVQCVSGRGKQWAAGHNHFKQLRSQWELWPAVGVCKNKALQRARRRPTTPPSAEGGDAHKSSKLLNSKAHRSGKSVQGAI